jgi:LysM repeat protein
MFRKAVAAAWLGILVGTIPVHAQSLRGSRTSMRKQNAVAQNQDYTFLETSADVWDFVEKGLLVPLNGNSNYKVEDAQYPYARPAVKLFVERLSEQYRSECGERLVVTSLTRPLSRQPANASDLSVHPAGMAVDLRRSKRSSCRRWLERTLSGLERKAVLEATRERTPPHYHIAIYPVAYNRYVASQSGSTEAKVAQATSSDGLKIAKLNNAASYASVVPVSAPAEDNAAVTEKATVVEKSVVEKSVADTWQYVVKRGDTLWDIARRSGITVSQLKRDNGLSRSYLVPGQKLTLPGSSRASAETPEQH